MPLAVRTISQAKGRVGSNLAMLPTAFPAKVTRSSRNGSAAVATMVRVFIFCRLQPGLVPAVPLAWLANHVTFVILVGSGAAPAVPYHVTSPLVVVMGPLMGVI